MAEPRPTLSTGWASMLGMASRAAMATSLLATKSRWAHNGPIRMNERLSRSACSQLIGGPPSQRTGRRPRAHRIEDPEHGGPDGSSSHAFGHQLGRLQLGAAVVADRPREGGLPYGDPLGLEAVLGGRSEVDKGDGIAQGQSPDQSVDHHRVDRPQLLAGPGRTPGTVDHHVGLVRLEQVYEVPNRRFDQIHRHPAAAGRHSQSGRVPTDCHQLGQFVGSFDDLVDLAAEESARPEHEERGHRTPGSNRGPSTPNSLLARS